MCALVIGPEVVTPSEYLPKILGADASQGPSFNDVQQAQEVLNLLTRHWHSIQSTLQKGDSYLPILLEGPARGAQWARGFLAGMEMRMTSWQPVLANDEERSALAPILILAYENHPDPKLRFEPLNAEQREEMLQVVGACMLQLYQRFRHERRVGGTRGAQPQRRSVPKIGRNEACTCGSGKKAKHCCLATRH